MDAQAQLFNHILLVEDEPAHARLITRALKDFVREITLAESFGLAKSELASRTPDLIISDLHLPDIEPNPKGGTGLTHIDYFHTAVPEIPVIVLTSSTDLRDAVEAMRLGARDFLVKNFNSDFREVLGFALARAFSNHQLETEKRRLERETALLRIAIDNSQDGFAIVDGSGAVLYANRGYQTIKEMCLQNGTSTSILDLFSGRVEKGAELRSGVVRHLNELSEGAVWHTQMEIKAETSAAFDLNLSIIHSEVNRQGVVSKNCVAWFRNITEQKRREKFQREILSTTTHDLKGPLGAILISTELLQESLNAESKAFEMVLRIASSAQGAVNLIDEFLSARRIQEGNFILRPSLHSVARVLAEVCETYRPIAAARKITFQFEAPAEEITAKVDKLGFARVVGNLLSNAVKFTPRGGAVTLRIFELDTNVHVVVEDTGSGMEPAEVQSVFERFSRLEKHREIAGTGIGLFVVKSIVHAHGGRIEVTSKVGQGTKFDLSFPAEPPVNARGELICLDFA